MSKLYPHFCGTCGSQLILEKKSSIFVCISCGNAYDYDYFPEDSLIDEAEHSLRSGDFVSARMSYSYILYREPNNCLALRGHLLCDLEAKYVSNLIATEYEFKPGVLYDYYMEESTSQFRSFFGDIKLLSELKDKRVRLEKKLEDSKKNVDQISDFLDPYKTRAKGGWVDEAVTQTKKGIKITQLLCLIIATTALILSILAMIAYAPKLKGDEIDFTALAIVIVAAIISIAAIAYYISAFTAAVSRTAEAKYIVTNNNRSYLRAEISLTEVENALEETKDLQKIVMNRAADTERRILIQYGVFEKINENANLDDSLQTEQRALS